MDMKVRREAVKPLAIGLDGETINVTYRPARITTASLRALADAEESVKKSSDELASGAPKTEVQGAIDFLAEIQKQTAEQIVAWDITDNAEPVPVTAAGMDAAGVDLALLTTLLVAIRENESPNAVKPAT